MRAGGGHASSPPNDCRLRPLALALQRSWAISSGSRLTARDGREVRDLGHRQSWSGACLRVRPFTFGRVSKL
jgi:hypothetical protein